MKIKLQILNRWTGAIIFELEKENNTLKDTVAAYIKKELENKYRANLTGADLTGANLTGADLTGANLTRADLTGADLTGANLTGANLTRADLTGADLTGANLTGANLTRADLTSADLTRADLTGANLTGANLTGADLTGADLTGANLTGANLTRADLTGADLTRADLTSIKNDLFIVLLHGIPEVEFLKQNIIEGKIDGSTYEGVCSCLSGTLERGAKVHNGPQETAVIEKILSCRNSSRPIERFFMNIKKGDTPENNQCSKLALQWVEEFQFLITAK